MLLCGRRTHQGAVVPHILPPFFRGAAVPRATAVFRSCVSLLFFAGGAARMEGRATCDRGKEGDESVEGRGEACGVINRVVCAACEAWQLTQGQPDE
jgi:hypothetical protein